MVMPPAMQCDAEEGWLTPVTLWTTQQKVNVFSLVITVQLRRTDFMDLRNSSCRIINRLQFILSYYQQVAIHPVKLSTGLIHPVTLSTGLIHPVTLSTGCNSSCHIINRLQFILSHYQQI
jgi:hypothetical protein